MHPTSEQFYPTITAVGGALGDTPLSNAALIEKYKLNSSDEAIRRLTGVEQRYHVANGELPSELGVRAARQAIERAGIESDAIKFFGVSNTLGDHISPTVASKMHAALDLNKQTAGVCDITAACAGAVANYEVACGQMMGFGHQTALVVSSEMLSPGINPNDRSTAILFGDGAGAMIIEQQAGANRPVFATLTHTDTEAINVHAGVATGFEGMQTEHRYIRMDGKRVRAIAGELLPAVAIAAARKAGIWNETTQQIEGDELGLFVPHQANYTMIGPLADLLGVPKEKRVETVMHHGNTSSASIPLALNHAYETGQVPRGERIRLLMLAIGAGLVAKAAVIDAKII